VKNRVAIPVLVDLRKAQASANCMHPIGNPPQYNGLHSIAGKLQGANSARSDALQKGHKIENMFGRLKDCRRIHTRCDRCAHTFFSSICIAAAIIFCL